MMGGTYVYAKVSNKVQCDDVDTLQTGIPRAEFRLIIMPEHVFLGFRHSARAFYNIINNMRKPTVKSYDVMAGTCIS